MEQVDPGEFILQSVFSDFSISVEQKIEHVVAHSEKPLFRCLQRTEDPHFDQVLSALGSLAENYLNSVIRNLVHWYHSMSTRDMDDYVKQRMSSQSYGPPCLQRAPVRSTVRDKDQAWGRREMALDLLFCQAALEPLKRLSGQFVDESFLQFVGNLAFRHFRDDPFLIPHTVPAANDHAAVASLYGDMVGAIAQTQLKIVRRLFLSHYKDVQSNSLTLMNLIGGMRFIRIKLFPVEMIEESFNFLMECANFFLECREKDVKYAFTAMFVDILLPLASSVKTELNVPVVKAFVEKMYPVVYEMSKKAKHSLVMYPFVTSLLCISQKSFFMANWSAFLNNCLQATKLRDVKIQRSALECLYRLIWVYVVRFRCENSQNTNKHLRSIVDALFKGSRTVIPKNIPLNYYVKIIQYIAQERLQFAMQDIIFDLLNINRSCKLIYPERMNIGLRSFLCIMESMQKKDGVPTLPGTLTGSGTLRLKRSYKLSDTTARGVGIQQYCTSVQKALGNVLSTLDVSVGRNLLLVSPQALSKETDDTRSVDRRLKIELFRTCIIAVTKFDPEGISRMELVEILSRLTLHVDEELKSLSVLVLQALMTDHPQYRAHILSGFCSTCLREVSDNFLDVLESSGRLLLNLITLWSSSLDQTQEENEESSDISPQESSGISPQDMCNSLHHAEGFCLVLLCSTSYTARKLGIHAMREVKGLAKALGLETEDLDTWLVDALDSVAFSVLTKVMPASSLTGCFLNNQFDLYAFTERLAVLQKDSTDCPSNDHWARCLGSLLREGGIAARCPTTVLWSWPFIYNRFTHLQPTIDSGIETNDTWANRATFSIRSSSKRPVALNDICLWRNYLTVGCCAPPCAAVTTLVTRSIVDSDRQEPMKLENSLDDMIKATLPVLRSEIAEYRDCAVNTLGLASPSAFRDLAQNLYPILKEVADRKVDALRKKKRRDTLRLSVSRILASCSANGCFCQSLSAFGDQGINLELFVDYIDTIRTSLEAETDKDTIYEGLQVCLAQITSHMLTSLSDVGMVNLLSRNMKQKLFVLFGGWCSGLPSQGAPSSIVHTELEVYCIEAMCALLCDPTLFDSNSLHMSNSHIYKFLESVLNSSHSRIQQLSFQTLRKLLENNPLLVPLMNWVVHQCYAGSPQLAANCFNALATVWCSRSITYKTITLLVLVLCKLGDAQLSVRDCARQMFNLMQRLVLNFVEPMVPPGYPTIVSGAFQTGLLSSLVEKVPELTLPVLSELFMRFEQASCLTQRAILAVISSWIKNIRLVVKISPSSHSASTLHDGLSTITFRKLDKDEDAAQAFTMSLNVLNNMMVITAKYAATYPYELSNVWSVLCQVSEGNTQEIVHYLAYMTGACGAAFLPMAKTIISFVYHCDPGGVLKALISDLREMEMVSNYWERLDRPPFIQHSQQLVNRVELTLSRCLWQSTSMEDTSKFGGSTEDSSKIRRLASLDLVQTTLSWVTAWRGAPDRHSKYLLLPMPEPLIHYAPVNSVIPLNSPVIPLYRCNLAMVLLAELLMNAVEVDWEVHLPLILHVAILSFDHTKSLVYEHCKQVLVHIVILLASRKLKGSLSQAVLDAMSISVDAVGITTPKATPQNSRSPTDTLNSSISINDLCNETVVVQYAGMFAKQLIQSRGKPLWLYEDVTPKVPHITSAQQLSDFLNNFLDLVEGITLTSSCSIRASLGREALSWATGCSSRHYACRSLQIFRSVGVPLTTTMMLDLLPRLADSVSDPSEDLQGYVMELIATFCSDVELFTQRNLHRSPFVVDNGGKAVDCTRRSSILNNELPSATDQGDIMLKHLWVGVSLLDSNFQHEFLLALKLVNMVIGVMTGSPEQVPNSLLPSSPSSPSLSTPLLLSNLLMKYQWHHFGGVQPLLVKGIIRPDTAEQTYQLLSSLIPLHRLPLVNTRPDSGLPLLVATAAPWLLTELENPCPLARNLAGSIAEACSSEEHLTQLGRVMAMYQDSSYTKSAQMLADVVCHNLLEMRPSYAETYIVLLVELLSCSISNLSRAVLMMLDGLLRYSSEIFHGQCFLSVEAYSRFLAVLSCQLKSEAKWKESMGILKNLSVLAKRPRIQSSVPRENLLRETLSPFDSDDDISAVDSESVLDGIAVDLKEKPLFVHWSSEGSCQKRVQKHLAKLLMELGHVSLAKESRSVVFSSCTDVSTESKPSPLMSIGGGDTCSSSHSGGRNDSLVSGQIKNVMRNFDFLDDELYSSRDAEGFPWTSSAADVSSLSSMANLKGMDSEDDDLSDVAHQLPKSEIPDVSYKSEVMHGTPEVTRDSPCVVMQSGTDIDDSLRLDSSPAAILDYVEPDQQSLHNLTDILETVPTTALQGYINQETYYRDCSSSTKTGTPDNSLRNSTSSPPMGMDTSMSVWGGSVLPVGENPESLLFRTLQDYSTASCEFLMKAWHTHSDDLFRNPDPASAIRCYHLLPALLQACRGLLMDRVQQCFSFGGVPNPLRGGSSSPDDSRMSFVSSNMAWLAQCISTVQMCLGEDCPLPVLHLDGGVFIRVGLMPLVLRMMLQVMEQVELFQVQAMHVDSLLIRVAGNVDRCLSPGPLTPLSSSGADPDSVNALVRGVHRLALSYEMCLDFYCHHLEEVEQRLDLGKIRRLSLDLPSSLNPNVPLLSTTSPPEWLDGLDEASVRNLLEEALDSEDAESVYRIAASLSSPHSIKHIDPRYSEGSSTKPTAADTVWQLSRRLLAAHRVHQQPGCFLLLGSTGELRALCCRVLDGLSDMYRSLYTAPGLISSP